MANHFISSTANPKVKNVVQLIKSAKARKTEKVFAIEGVKEVLFAIEAGYEIMEVFINPAIFTDGILKSILEKQFPDLPVYEVSTSVFSKMAYRDESGGIIALAHLPEISLENIKLSDNPILVVLSDVEKPGNIGAVLRTADAINADAVIVCDTGSDIYNPNVIRSSVGCIFHRQVLQLETETLIEWLKNKGIKIMGTSIQTASYYHLADFTKPVAIVLGSEAKGLSEKWLQNADELIKIPMLGRNDSLNVSNAAAVILYEACKQRGFEMKSGK
jgi:RNA methyltransferase, TrmH family